MKLHRLAVDRGLQSGRTVELEDLADALVPVGRQEATGGVEMETPLGQVRPGAQVEEPQLIRIVRDEDDACRDRFPIDLQPEWPRMGGRAKQRANSRQRVASATVRLAAVDERGVGAERDVVQEKPFADPADVDPPFLAAEGRERRQRIRTVKPEVARKVVPCPERDTDKLQLALDRDLRDRRQRPVAPCDAEGIRAGFARELPGIVALAEDPYLDSRSCAAAASSSTLGRPFPERGLIRRKPANAGGSIGPMAS